MQGLRSIHLCTWYTFWTIAGIQLQKVLVFPTKTKNIAFLTLHILKLDTKCFGGKPNFD